MSKLSHKFIKGDRVIAFSKHYRVEDALVNLTGDTFLLICSDCNSGQYVQLEPQHCILTESVQKFDSHLRITL